MNFPLNVVVGSAVRTPVGRGVKGTLKNTRPDDLAATAIKAAVERAGNLGAEHVDDVILGCAMPEAEQGMNVARNAVFLADFPETVSGETINRFCSSGLQAIAHGAMAVQTGLNDVVIAGGVESMSMIPMGGSRIRLNPKLTSEYPEAYMAMGHTAERVAAKFDVSREAQDEFAAHSHKKASEAWEKNLFADEIVPVDARIFGEDGAATIAFTKDECVRPDTSMEGLAKLRPAFSVKGTVTAGNSSPLSDGAAALTLLSDARANALEIDVLGRFCGFAVAGIAPEIMGIGPVPAIQKLLTQTGLKIEDIDLFEINEAFAAQAVYCQRELGLDVDKLNVHGGAIALGHPLGCSGAKLGATILHELKRRGGRYGIVSMCIGGGMGAAGLFVRDN